MAEGKHIALANSIEKDITSGKFGKEGGLPAVSEIAQEHRLSINTVKNALAVLEGKGLIVKRGIGYYVNNIEIDMSYLGPAHSQRPDSFKRNIGTIKSITLPEHLARTAQIEASTPTTYKMQISGTIENEEEKPIQIAHKYYLLLISDETLKRMNDDSSFDPVAELGGELLSQDELSSRLATDNEKDLLAIDENTPILNVVEIIRDQQDKLLLIQEVSIVRSTLIFKYPFTNK